jgi:preprotein translocase subunit SecF
MKTTWPPKRSKNRTMIALPVAVAAVLFVAILVLGVPLSGDFRRGTLVTVRGVENTPDAGYIKSQTESLTGLTVDVRLTTDGFDILTGTLAGNSENLVRDLLITQFGLPENSITIGALGATILSSQVAQLIGLVTGAPIVMALIILVLRKRTAAITMLAVAGLNTVDVLGLMALSSVQLGLVSIIGILVTFGFAIDMNVLISSRMRLGVGDHRENLGGALRAGLAMSAVALAVLLSASVLASSSSVNEFIFALVFGLVMNNLNTWFLTAPLFLRQAEGKKVVGYHVSI